MLGERTAEEMKMTLGSAFPLPDRARRRDPRPRHGLRPAPHRRRLQLRAAPGARGAAAQHHRRGPHHPRPDAARAGRRHHGPRHRAHRRRRHAPRPRRAAAPRDRHARPRRRGPAVLGRLRRGQVRGGVRGAPAGPRLGRRGASDASGPSGDTTAASGAGPGSTASSRATARRARCWSRWCSRASRSSRSTSPAAAARRWSRPAARSARPSVRPSPPRPPPYAPSPRCPPGSAARATSPTRSATSRPATPSSAARSSWPASTATASSSTTASPRAAADLGSALVPARVVALGSRQSQSFTVTIDAGSDAGVGPDMTVVNNDGLVGRVLRVTRSTATVLLIVDPDSTVGGRVGSSMEIGFVNGSGSLDQDAGLDLRLVDDASVPAARRHRRDVGQQHRPLRPGRADRHDHRGLQLAARGLPARRGQAVRRLLRPRRRGRHGAQRRRRATARSSRPTGA